MPKTHRILSIFWFFLCYNTLGCKKKNDRQCKMQKKFKTDEAGKKKNLFKSPKNEKK